MITNVDEQLHPAGANPHWQESFYFNWADPAGTTFGLTRIGHNPAKGTGDAVVITLRDGQPEYVYAKVGVKLNPEAMRRSMEQGLQVGRLRYTLEEPLKRWRVQLDGKAELDLTWTAFTPAIDFDHAFPGADEDVQRHFEQSGTVEGTLHLDGESHKVLGFGQRDKSWGVRDWNGIEGWDWIAGQFGPDLSFNTTTTDINGVRTPVGFVFRDGEAQQVTDVDITYTWDGAEHLPKTVVMDVTVADGTAYTITGSALARIPLIKNGLFIEETHTAFEVELDGVVRRGVGVVEHAYHVGAIDTLRRLPRLAKVIAMARKGTA